MIVISNDATNNLPFDNEIISNLLEKVTGADIMISPIDLPITSEFLIKKHIEAGAVLIQQKNGMDIIHSSQNGRLTSQLARMYESGAKYAWQRILMFVGTVEEKDWKAILNGVEIGTWWQWQGIQDAFAWSRGGTFVHLPTLPYTKRWIEAVEKTLPDRIAKRTVDVFPHIEFPDDLPDKDDPLQLPMRVTDWRKALVAIADGVGPQKATDLRNTMLEHGSDDTLIQALVWATDNTGMFPKVPGWGKGTIEKVRQAIGMGESTTGQLSIHFTGANE